MCNKIPHAAIGGFESYVMFSVAAAAYGTFSVMLCSIDT